MYKTVSCIDNVHNIVLDENGESFSTYRTFYRRNQAIPNACVVLPCHTQKPLYRSMHGHDSTRVACTLRRKSMLLVGALVKANGKSKKYARLRCMCDIQIDELARTMHVCVDADSPGIVRIIEGDWMISPSAEDHDECSRWTAEYNGPRHYVTFHVAMEDARICISVHFNTPDQYGCLSVH